MKNKYGQDWSYNSITINGKKYSPEELSKYSVPEYIQKEQEYVIEEVDDILESSDTKKIEEAEDIESTKNTEEAEINIETEKKKNTSEVDRMKVRELLDENFVLGSELLLALSSKQSPEKMEGLQAKFDKLHSNLLVLKPRLTRKIGSKSIYDKGEYDENLRNLEYMGDLLGDTDNMSDFYDKNIYRIRQAVEYFINDKTKNTRLNQEDIGFQVGRVTEDVKGSIIKRIKTKLAKGITRFPISKVLSYPRGIEQDKVNGANIVSYHEELDNRVLFIQGINTVVEGRTEFTDEKHDKYGTGFFGGWFPQVKGGLAKIPFFKNRFDKKIKPLQYEGNDRINASGEGTNFAGIADIFAERGYGVDYLNQFYLGDRKKVEASIKKAQEFLESEEGKKVEVIYTHSYGGTIARALDLSKTNVKKVVTIAAPYKSHIASEGIVSREQYAKSIANRNVKWVSVGLKDDGVVPGEHTQYADEKHLSDVEVGHYEGFFVKKLDTEKWKEILDFAKLKKKM